jgi:iron complex outermembrane receptor protein
MLQEFSLFDFSLGYNFKISKLQLNLNGKVLNIFDEKYSSNGSVSGSGKAKYYPQAGRNFLVGLNLKF